jgi:hypothetical protein
VHILISDYSLGVFCLTDNQVCFPSRHACQIAKFLEQRSRKELRAAHVNYVKIITEAYSKLLFICKEQM